MTRLKEENIIQNMKEASLLAREYLSTYRELSDRLAGAGEEEAVEIKRSMRLICETWEAQVKRYQALERMYRAGN